MDREIEIVTISSKTYHNMVKEIKYLRNELKMRPTKVVYPPLWRIILSGTIYVILIIIILTLFKQ